MKKIIGFRSIAIHDYKNIDEEILVDVIENHLDKLLDFARQMISKKDKDLILLHLFLR